jgi:hypothetical protein
VINERNESHFLPREEIEETLPRRDSTPSQFPYFFTVVWLAKSGIQPLATDTLSASGTQSPRPIFDGIRLDGQSIHQENRMCNRF